MGVNVSDLRIKGASQKRNKVFVSHALAESFLAHRNCAGIELGASAGAQRLSSATSRARLAQPVLAKIAFT